jgi:hypothetical protein
MGLESVQKLGYKVCRGCWRSFASWLSRKCCDFQDLAKGSKRGVRSKVEFGVKYFPILAVVPPLVVAFATNDYSTIIYISVLVTMKVRWKETAKFSPWVVARCHWEHKAQSR